MLSNVLYKNGGVTNFMSTSNAAPQALIVEDDTDTSFILQRALKKVGFEVSIAYNGNDAADKLKETYPDVIFLDLALPYVSGEELLEMIRDDETLSKTLVVVVTANVQAAHRVSDDADMLITKPVLYSHLIDVAKDLIDRI